MIIIIILRNLLAICSSKTEDLFNCCVCTPQQGRRSDRSILPSSTWDGNKVGLHLLDRITACGGLIWFTSPVRVCKASQCHHRCVRAESMCCMMCLLSLPLLPGEPTVLAKHLSDLPSYLFPHSERAKLTHHRPRNANACNRDCWCSASSLHCSNPIYLRVVVSCCQPFGIYFEEKSAVLRHLFWICIAKFINPN